MDARLRLQVYLEAEGSDGKAAELETINISTSGVYFLSNHFIVIHIDQGIFHALTIQ